MSLVIESLTAEPAVPHRPALAALGRTTLVPDTRENDPAERLL